MSEVFDMPDDYSVSDFLDKPGQYHVVVEHVDENPTSRGGKLLDGIRVKFRVLGGTESTQLKRAHDEVIFKPSVDAKDGGAFARKKIGRLIRALGLHDQGTGKLAVEVKQAKIDWMEARGRQMVVYMVPQEDEARYMQIQGAHIYAVTDAECSHVPKNEKALKLMAAGQQSAPTQPAAQQTQAQPQTQPQQPQQQQVQQPVAAAATSGGGDDWDQLFN